MIETIRFPIRGMTCTACVSRITRTLRRLEGVERVRIDLGAEVGTVRRDRLLAPDASIAAAVAGAGYLADLEGAIVIPTVDRPGFAARLTARLRG